MMGDNTTCGMSFSKEHLIPHFSGPFPSHIPDELLKLIPYSVAKKHLIIPISMSNTSIILGTSIPHESKLFQSLAWTSKLKIQIFFMSKGVVLKYLQRIYLPKKDKENTSNEIIHEYQNREKAYYDLISDNENDPIIKSLNLLISDAIEQNASDIHFEPQEDGLTIRFRIDGVLQTKSNPIQRQGKKTTSRIKILSKMDVAQSRLPQDGRIHFSLGDRIIDTRVSTIPTLYGERVVLRLLDKKTLLLNLEDLHLPSKDHHNIHDLLKSQEGMIIVTGPTGSGKTTTLYSFLSTILSSNRNIMTIEDPVEYHLKGISQTNVNPSIDLQFSTGLRHILRQDPDVIMIGEIRDHEAAQIAFQASLTGHLVLSTLHANNAPATAIRLLDMGVDPVLINSTLLASVSQRLIRTICTSCKHEVSSSSCDFQTYTGSGCKECSFTGYKGRAPIFEIMYMDDEIRHAVSNHASSKDLFHIAKKNGMQTLKESGLLLVKKGLTSLEEVYRIT